MRSKLICASYSSKALKKTPNDKKKKKKKKKKNNMLDDFTTFGPSIFSI